MTSQTFQTSEPVKNVPLNDSARTWGDLIRMVKNADMTYDLPYQRGDVWDTGQRMMLVYSILSGTPVPALIVNYRPQEMWFADDGSQLPVYAVIDGKQRLASIRMFMEGDLAVPASWFPAGYVEETEETGDGRYVRYAGLARPAQRFFENTPVPVAEAQVKTVADEASIYLRVNGAGTPQTTGDIARAAGLAETAVPRSAQGNPGPTRRSGGHQRAPGSPGHTNPARQEGWTGKRARG